MERLTVLIQLKSQNINTLPPNPKNKQLFCLLMPRTDTRELNWNDAACPNFSPRSLLLTGFLAEVRPIQLAQAHSTSSQLFPRPSTPTRFKLPSSTSLLFISLIITIDYYPQQPGMSSDTFGASTLTFASLCYLGLCKKQGLGLLLT
jgi:hypothetical protein